MTSANALHMNAEDFIAHTSAIQRKKEVLTKLCTKRKTRKLCALRKQADILLLNEPEKSSRASSSAPLSSGRGHTSLLSSAAPLLSGPGHASRQSSSAALSSMPVTRVSASQLSSSAPQSFGPAHASRLPPSAQLSSGPGHASRLASSTTLLSEPVCALQLPLPAPLLPEPGHALQLSSPAPLPSEPIQPEQMHTLQLRSLSAPPPSEAVKSPRLHLPSAPLSSEPVDAPQPQPSPTLLQPEPDLQSPSSMSQSPQPKLAPNKVHRHNRRFRRTNKIEVDHKQVINLSSIVLTAEQTHVLSLGPKFCPTPGTVNKLQLFEDTKEGMRKVRLKEYFFDKNVPNQISRQQKFYKKTYWCPQKGRDPALDTYCSAITTRIKSCQPGSIKHRNITKQSQQAINELKQLVNNCKVRIIPADKGGAVVVQDFEDYKAEALRQLSDTTTYELLIEDPTKNIAKKSNEIIDDLLKEGHINVNTHRWGTLNIYETKCHTFYHLPKVHKDKRNPPGRPIVSGIDGPTERLSKLVDFWLQPVVHQLPSFLQDTTHFLRVIEEWKDCFKPLPAEALIVTIDVVGLYTNIPHSEVSPSIKETLEEFNAPDAPPHDQLVSTVNHILQNNIFQFDNKIYKQKFGTAMGTPMAPSIANIFMHWLEKNIISRSPWPLDPKTWKRFIDDIILLWLHGEEELKRFLEWINTLHSSIKFTAHYGTTNIPFLDVNLSIVEGSLTTDLHVKPTDANMCLPFHSCHPRHCPRSIPYSQCLRLRRICSDNTTFQKRAKELKDKLLKRGYPENLLQAAIYKVMNIPREDTLLYKEKKFNERVPVIITHNPGNPPLSNWLKDYMPLLHSSSRMRKAVPHPPMVGERNCRNLRSLLMPSKLPKVSMTQERQQPPPPQQRLPIQRQQQLQQQQLQPQQEQPQQPPHQRQQQQPQHQQQLQLDHQQQEQQQQEQQNQLQQLPQQQEAGCHKCTRKRCILCKNHTNESKTFKSVVNGAVYRIRDKMTCRSSNIVYLIDCDKCASVQYVGETGQTLQQRFYGHSFNIRHYDPNASQDPTQSQDRRREDTMVAKHFNETGHTIMDMRCTAIEQIHSHNESVRKHREKFWRHQLQTHYPDGLNVFD